GLGAARQQRVVLADLAGEAAHLTLGEIGRPLRPVLRGAIEGAAGARQTGAGRFVAVHLPHDLGLDEIERLLLSLRYGLSNRIEDSLFPRGHPTVEPLLPSLLLIGLLLAAGLLDAVLRRADQLLELIDAAPHASEELLGLGLALEEFADHRIGGF